jgi:hypothetical protein
MHAYGFMLQHKSLRFGGLSLFDGSGGVILLVAM